MQGAWFRWIAITSRVDRARSHDLILSMTNHSGAVLSRRDRLNRGFHFLDHGIQALALDPGIGLGLQQSGFSRHGIDLPDFDEVIVENFELGHFASLD
jgi:hypothetical protein